MFLCEVARQIKALQYLNLQECSVSSASAAASEWMLHCWENLETKPAVMITAVVLNSWSFYSAMWGEKGKESSNYFWLYYQQPHRSSGLCFWGEDFQGTTPVSCNARNRLPLSALFSVFFFLSLRNTVLRNKSRAQVYQKWCRYDSSALQNTVWEKLYSWESEPNTNAAKCIFRITLTRPFIFVFVVSLLWVVLGSPRCVLSWQAASLMTRGSQLFCHKKLYKLFQMKTIAINGLLSDTDKVAKTHQIQEIQESS